MGLDFQHSMASLELERARGRYFVILLLVALVVTWVVWLLWADVPVYASSRNAVVTIPSSSLERREGLEVVAEFPVAVVLERIRAGQSALARIDGREYGGVVRRVRIDTAGSFGEITVGVPSLEGSARSVSAGLSVRVAVARVSPLEWLWR